MQAHEPAGRYLPTLDGWRAIAITMVVASHAVTVDSAQGGGMLNLLTFRLGTFGVMLFFAISGYLICTRLLVEQERTGSISLRSFYIRRVFRILPAAWTYLAAIAALAALGIVSAGWRDIAAGAFFFANYAPPQSWFVGHFWSLAMEEHFYVLWPPILALAGRRKAIGVGVLLIVATVLLRSFTMAHAAAGADLPGYTHLRLDVFMFPCILAILLRTESFARRFTAAMKPMVWLSLIAVLALGIAAGVEFPAWREPQRIFQSAALPVIIAATVLRPNDWFGRFLRLPALEWLGRASYSVYLWQQLVFGFAPRHWPARMLELPLLIAALLALAALSLRWIEQPWIETGKRLASRRRVKSCGRPNVCRVLTSPRAARRAPARPAPSRRWT